MASNAIQAQGTNFKIQGTAGSAKAISAISAADPPQVTATDHGFTKGDVIAISGVVGTMDVLNGNSYTIKTVTTHTFELVGVDTTGLTRDSGGTATVWNWISVGELKTISGFDGAAGEVDITNLDSTAKEFSLGLQDFGNLTLELNQYNSDVGQIAIRSAKASGATKAMKLTLLNAVPASAERATCFGLVKSFSMSLGVDQVVTGSVTIRISGEVFWQ